MERHSHLRRWGAAYLLLALFLASWLGQFYFGVMEVRSEAEQHGQVFMMSEFWPKFWFATFENWQSEWLQLFLQAVVLLGMKHILFKADAEDMETVQRDLVDIKKALGLPADDPGESHTTH
jgi:hypothetical protein